MARRHRTSRRSVRAWLPALVLVAAGVALVLVGLHLNDGSGQPTSTHGPESSGPYARPKLESPTTLTVSRSNTQLELDKDRDYIIKLPSGQEPLASGVSLIGGRNVIIDGGTITVPNRTAGESADENDRRALYLKDQTGVTWIHNVRLEGDLAEGIDINDQNDTSTVILLDITAGKVSGYSSDHHPDLLQSFAGPHKLYVNGFSGSTDYQGFFLLPEEHYPDHPPALFSLSNIAIDDSDGAYALWRSVGDTWPLQLSNVCVVPPAPSRNLWLWPKPSTGDASWREVRAATSCPAP